MAIEDLIFAVISCTVQLVAILDPVAVVPIYLTYVGSYSREVFSRVTRTIALFVFILSLAISLGGRLWLLLLGVSVAALKVGGGVLLMAIAIDALSGLPRTKVAYREDVPVVPIATPLLVGPGTITLLLVLPYRYGFAATLIAIVLATLVTYLVLRFSRSLMKLLGRSGVVAVSRLTSIVIAAFAAEMIYSGLRDWGLVR